MLCTASVFELSCAKLTRVTGNFEMWWFLYGHFCDTKCHRGTVCVNYGFNCMMINLE